jgi:ABC-2 type transport system permease protein
MASNAPKSPGRGVVVGGAGMRTTLTVTGAAGIRTRYGTRVYVRPAMKALVIAGSSLRRLFRDRSNIFFVLILPLLLVLVIGSVFGGDFSPAVGVVAPGGDPLAQQLVDELESSEAIDVVDYDREDDLLGAVERGDVQAGVVLPDGYTDALANPTGDDPVEIGFVARPTGFGPQLQATVQAVVGPQAARVRAAKFAAEEGAGDFDAALERATELQAELPQIEARTTTVGDETFPSTLGQFDLGASSQLVMFVFIVSLTGSAALIQSRRLGVARRMLSTPTSMRTVLAGETLGRYGVALFQGLYIMGFSLLLFGVRWGDPVGAVAILLLFALVGAGAGMLMGSIFRNDQQAAGIGVILGLGLGALGGAMTPIEFFSPTMARIAHITPHAWALDGFAELVREHGTVVDICVELAVLAAMAATVLVLANSALRRALTSGR